MKIVLILSIASVGFLIAAAANGAAIYVVDQKVPSALRIDGYGQPIVLNVYDTSTDSGFGAIQVNSSSLYGIRVSGNPVISASEVDACAYYPPDSSPLGSGFCGTFLSGMPPLPDPLARLQVWMDNFLKNNPIMTMPPLVAAPGMLQPGYYPNGIDIQGDVVLNPGMYILGGSGAGNSATGGLQIHGSIVGHGVYIYVIGGQVDLTEAARLHLSAIPLGPDAPEYGGVVIHQAASNVNVAHIMGNETFIEGTVYFPKAQLWLAGTIELCQIICNTLRIYGASQLAVIDDGRFAVPVAPRVNAGSDQTIVFSLMATLAGAVSDDGMPDPPGFATYAWSMVSGPGPVLFDDANALNTKVNFFAIGTYVLRLTATDSVLSSFDDVAITVLKPGDFNGDGQVDGLDFLIWQAHYPNPVGKATIDGGDANGDGKVDGRDFLVWQANYSGHGT